MTTTHLWLIRHGEPDPCVDGRCYGDLDVGLSEKGRKQMREVAQRFAAVPLHAICSSPKRRARESAELLAEFQKRSVEMLDGLAEINFGLFEGRSYDQISSQYPEIYRQWMERPTEVQFPEGESFERMRARVITCADLLREKYEGRSVALVTHGGVIRILLAEALGIPAPNIFRIGQNYGAVNLITYVDQTPIVELTNAVLNRGFPSVGGRRAEILDRNFRVRGRTQDENGRTFFSGG